MNLHALGIAVGSQRDAGTLVQYSFALPLGQEEALLEKLLTNMPSGSELSVLDPVNADCSLEAKRLPDSYHVKRGCHGAYGTWRPATFSEAHAWLIPGALAAGRLARPGFGVMLVVPK